MIQEKSVVKKAGIIGVRHHLVARAPALFRLITEVVGKSIVGEKEAKARHPSNGENIVGTTGKRADQEVDRHGSKAVVKRNGRASVNRTVTMIAERLAGTGLQNTVRNIQRRNIVGNEDLPVHRLMNRAVRGTENVRRETRGLSRWI